MVVEWWQNGSKTVAFFHHAGSCEDAEAVGRGPGRRKKPYRYRWSNDVRDEVLARLLELNANRAEHESKRRR